MTERGLDEPETDVVEQARDAVPGADDSGNENGLPREVPLEADAADTSEQTREIDLGDEEYR